MRKGFGVIVLVALALSFMVPAAAEQEQGQRQKVRLIMDGTPIVCPARPLKTGDASFDAFWANFNQCKILPTKHWWEFWKKRQPVLKERKTPKEPTPASALFSIHWPY